MDEIQKVLPNALAHRIGTPRNVGLFESCGQLAHFGLRAIPDIVAESFQRYIQV